MLQVWKQLDFSIVMTQTCKIAMLRSEIVNLPDILLRLNGILKLQESITLLVYTIGINYIATHFLSVF